MSRDPVDALLTLREVARLFDLTESRLRYWAQTGFINPSGRRGGRRAYAFTDLVEIRAAKELLAAGIPLRRVRANLEALRRTLPGEQGALLARLRVVSDGETLAVADERAAFSPVSGQLLLDFEIGDVHREAAKLLELKPAGRPARGAAPEERGDPGRRPAAAGGDEVLPPAEDAYGWFRRGCALEEQGGPRAEAEAAYRRALDLDPGLAAAHTNLGNLHYHAGERDAARAAYERALALDPDQPEARYNLANIYEEEGDLDMAIAEYRRALHENPAFADAHFNLALALEQVGGRAQARHHWRRFLDLAPDEPDLATWRALAAEHLARLEERG